MSREERENCPYCDRERGLAVHFYECTSCGMHYCIKCASRHVCQGQCERPDELTALRQQLAEARAEVDRLRQACVKQQHDIQQVLGKALGYPAFPQEFNAGNQVCVGDHIAETLADEAANKLAAQSAEVERLRERLEAAEKGTLDHAAAESALQRIHALVQSVLLYANHGHLGPDASGVVLLRDISDIAQGWLPPAAGTNNETKG